MQIQHPALFERHAVPLILSSGDFREYPPAIACQEHPNRRLIPLARVLISILPFLTMAFTLIREVAGTSGFTGPQTQHRDTFMRRWH